MGEHRMMFNVYNTSTGETVPMEFDSEQQMKDWTKETGWVCLGEQTTYLPTRHERMKNKEEFAGWGS
jgi:hypothetical protein